MEWPGIDIFPMDLHNANAVQTNRSTELECMRYERGTLSGVAGRNQPGI